MTDGNDKKVAKKSDKGNKGKGRPKSQPAASDSKGKRKAPPDDDDTDTIESTSDVTTKPTKSKTQKKNQTKAKESRPTEVEVDADDAVEPKKKKMKKLNVNIFGSAKPDSLDWANQFNLVSRIAIQALCSCVVVTGDCNVDAIDSGRWRFGDTDSTFAIEGASPLFGPQICVYFIPIELIIRWSERCMRDCIDWCRCNVSLSKVLMEPRLDIMRCGCW